MTSKFLSFKKTLWLFIKFFSILIFLLFNLVVIFSFTWNLFTPVKKVKFVGYPIDKQSILKKLELEKKSILFLSTQDLEEKLKNPTTKIQLTKFLPYFIHFSVSKKEPLAYLQIGKKSFFLDSEELAFPVAAFNNLNLPIIRFSKTFHKDNYSSIQAVSKNKVGSKNFQGITECLDSIDPDTTDSAKSL